jgi:hypothetical protein
MPKLPSRFALVRQRCEKKERAVDLAECLIPGQRPKADANLGHLAFSRKLLTHLEMEK